MLAPAGVRRGVILFEGTPLDEVGQRTQSERIGFVQQSPENQIVTDIFSRLPRRAAPSSLSSVYG